MGAALQPRRPRTERLLAAVLPRPLPDAPAWDSLDWLSFWQRFEAAAPLHLRLGLDVAVFVVGWLYLGAFGCGGADADAARRDLLLRRASAQPLLGLALGPLLEVLRLVAALAYFDDPRTQRAFRGGVETPRLEARWVGRSAPTWS